MIRDLTPFSLTPFSYGLWSALDFDGNAAVGPMVLSKKELDDKKIKASTESVNVKEEIKGIIVL